MEQDPVVERQLQGHKAPISCIAFNTRERSIASGDLDNSIMVWNLKKSASSLKLQGHCGPVLDLSFSTKTNLLASASQDRTVRLWVPTFSGRSSDFKAHFSAVRSVDFSPDGEKLVTGSDDKSVKLWTLESKRRFTSSMTQHSNWVRCARFSFTGNLVGSCGDDCTAVLWDIRDSKKPVEVLEQLDSSPQSLAFQPGHDNVFALAFASGHVRIYDMRAPQHLLQTYKAHSDVVNQITFHPTGQLLISASADGNLKVLDLLEGRPIYTLSMHRGSVTGVAFSPHGHLFASVGEDRQVIVWRASDGSVSPAPRTPVSNDPRSPMLQPGINMFKRNISVASGFRKNTTSTSTLGLGHLTPDCEAVQSLEERVRRLEVLLQATAASGDGPVDYPDTPTSAPGPLGGLEKRVDMLEERIINNQLENINIGS